MNRTSISSLLALTLLGVTASAAAQTASQFKPLNLQQKNQINAAVKPKEIHGDCKSTLAKEFTAYTSRVGRGLQVGVISAAERGALEAEYNKLKGKEAAALKDGNIDAKECAALYDDLTDLNNHLGDALCSREVPAANQAAAVNAVKQAAAPRVGNAPVNPNAGMSLCIAEISHMVTLFEDTIKRGKSAGLIDANEERALETGRAKLAADEKKALSDNKISVAELKRMMVEIDAENRKLDAAMASPAAAAKVAKAPAHPPLNLKQKPKSTHAALKPKEIHGDCKMTLDKEFTAYTTRVTRGLQAGVISAAERGELEGEYNRLKGKETAALKDGKIDAKECAALYDDLTDLNNHLGDALCSREVPAANQAVAVNAVKQIAAPRVGNAPVTPNPGLALCVAEISHMVSLFEDTIKRGKAAGLIDANEEKALEAGRAKLASDEKKAVSDHKISQAELKKMMVDIDGENKKLDAAMASPAAVTKAAAANPLLNLQKKKKVHAALKPKEIHGDCKAVMDKEFKAYTDRVGRGLQAGVISVAERGALEKEYNALKAKETAAMKDGKVDAKECAAMYDDLADLNNHLGDALCSREVPVANRAAVGNFIKASAGARASSTQVVANANALCVAEVSHMVSLFEDAIKRGKAAGMIDANEEKALEVGRAKLLADEKKALTDKNITTAELKQIMVDIDGENRKLDAAMATPAKAALAKK